MAEGKHARHFSWCAVYRDGDCRHVDRCQLWCVHRCRFFDRRAHLYCEIDRFGSYYFRSLQWPVCWCVDDRDCALLCMIRYTMLIDAIQPRMFASLHAPEKVTFVESFLWASSLRC